jgi:hypothetical protein
LPAVDGYVLAAELAGVALAAELGASFPERPDIVVEVDNPLVARIFLEGYRPPQADRIPQHIMQSAEHFARSPGVSIRVLKRNATAGLRRAHALARDRLARHKRRK